MLRLKKTKWMNLNDKLGSPLYVYRKLFNDEKDIVQVDYGKESGCGWRGGVDIGHVDHSSWRGSRVKK